MRTKPCSLCWLTYAQSQPLAVAATGIWSLVILFYLTLAIMLGTFLNSRGAVLGIALGFLFLGMLIPNALPQLAAVFPWKLDGIAVLGLVGVLFDPQRERVEIEQQLSVMRQTAAGRVAVEQDHMPPGVLGRICHHPCEKDCRRGREGEQRLRAARAREHKDVGIRRKDRRDPTTDKLMFSGVFVYASQVLGVTAPELFLRQDWAGELELMNARCSMNNAQARRAMNYSECLSTFPRRSP